MTGMGGSRGAAVGLQDALSRLSRSNRNVSKYATTESSMRSSGSMTGDTLHSRRALMVVRISRLALFFVLSAVLAVFASVTHVLLRGSETDSFQAQLSSAIDQVEAAAVAGIATRNAAVQTVADYIQRAVTGRCPNITVAADGGRAWQAFTENVVDIAQIRNIVLEPIIPVAELQGFNAFARESWDVLIGGREVPTTTNGWGNVERGVWEYVGRNVDKIPVNESQQDFGPRPFYVANLQPGPVGPATKNEDSMMYDVYSEEGRRVAMQGAIDTGSAFSSDFVQLVPDGPMVDGKITRASSLIFAPVFYDAVFPDTPPPAPSRGFPTSGNRTVIAFASCFFSWDALFMDALPQFITGIDIVMQSSRGVPFTFGIANGKVVNVGEGNIRRSGWMDRFGRSFELEVNPAHDGISGNWTVAIYPRDDLLQVYLTDSPRDFAIGAGGLIVLVVLLAFCFDSFSRSQLSQLKKEHAIERQRMQVIGNLRANLASSSSEDAAMAAALEALRQLFPTANGILLGKFDKDEGCEKTDVSAVYASEEGGKAALLKSAPETVGSIQASLDDETRSSIAFLCSMGGKGLKVVDSDFSDGVAAFHDWRTASNGGLKSSRAVSTLLSAGHSLVGFATLHFGEAPDFSVIDLLVDSDFSELVGSVIFVKRAFAVSDGTEDLAKKSGKNTSGHLVEVAVDDNERADSSGQVLRRPARASVCSAFTSADHKQLDELDWQLTTSRQQLMNWELDPWQLEIDDVKRLMILLFHDLGLLRRFTITPAQMRAFVAAVAPRYRDNPFHNFRHCFTVALAAWRFVAHSNVIRSHLQDIDLLSLLVAAVCHDLEHPGLTNGFQIASESVLARRYNDVKVLESHHAAVAFEVIEESRIFSGFSLADRKVLRKTVIEAILHTDMATHKELVARVKSRHQEGQLLNTESDSDRHLLVGFLLHCADLCNPTLPHHMSVRIAEGLGEEFEGQAAQERELGHPVSVMLAPTVLRKAELEIGFITFVVMPLYVLLTKVAPDLVTFVDRVESNLEMWSELRDSQVPLPGQSTGHNTPAGRPGSRGGSCNNSARGSSRDSLDVPGSRGSKRLALAMGIAKLLKGRATQQAGGSGHASP